MNYALAGVLALLLGSAGAWGALIKESIIAPATQDDPMSADDMNDPFSHCPIYALHQNGQIVKQGDLKEYSVDDFRADLRLLWTADALYLRFDLADDVQHPISEPDLSQPLIGDYIRLSFRHRTIGANRRSEVPWGLLLFPDLKGQSCGVALEMDDKVTAARVGDASQITTRVFAYQDLSSLVVRIPTAGWDDAIRRGGLLRFQALYYDDDASDDDMADLDAKPEIDHIYSYFPVNRSLPTMDLLQFGEIYFAEDVWLTARPTDVMYADGKLRLLMDYGNLTNSPLSVTVQVTPAEGVSPPPVKTFTDVMQLPAGKTAQNQALELGLEDLPGGSFRVMAQTRLIFDPSPIVVDKPQGHTLLFLRDKIEWQPKQPRRALSLYDRREQITETFRYMAGGGKVLWSAGLYDAASTEFRQVLRDRSPYEVSLPESTDRNLPWALFGGLDKLDGMNEPLVVKIGESMLVDKEPLQPEMPEFVHVTNDRTIKRKAVRSRRLLLVGLAYDYVDENSFPEIVAKAGRRVVLQQRLLGAPDAGGGNRRIYVLRLWLEENEREVAISNVAPFGPKAEIDFMALIGPGERTGYAEGSSSLEFGGSEEASLFTRELATSLFFMRNYLVDRSGGSYSSLPGGEWEGQNGRDFGLLMQELSIWGANTEARQLSSQIPRRMAIMRDEFSRQGEMTLGYPCALIGLHELWRHMDGDRNNFLRRIWLSSVHQPVTDLMTNMGRNPQGLAEATGDFGVSGQGSAGSSLPMNLASWAALRRSSEMAATIGQAADRWERETRRLEGAISRYLIAPTGGINVFSPHDYPESFGIPAQSGIQAVIPQNAWLYGLYRHGKPVLYNRNRRVFDTPYVLSGAPYYSDANGYLFNDQYLLSAQTTLNYLYIVSPVFQGGQRSFLASDLLDYDTSNHQLWTAYTAFMIDNYAIGSKMLNAYVRYTFDEYAPLPQSPRSQIEISPYTFEEKLNSGEHGENLGASGDDLNVTSATLAMRTARMLLGLDDSNGEQVKLSPRLPDGWTSIDAKSWEIVHKYDKRVTAPFDIHYEKLLNDRYLLSVKGEDELTHLEVRFGPFASSVRRVEVTSSGNRDRISTQNINGLCWATATFRNVKDLEVSVKPAF